MRKIAFTAALAIVGLSACEKAITEPEGPLTGTWHYRAVDLLHGAASPNDMRCTIDLRFDVVQDGNLVEGVTRAGESIVCRNIVTGASDPIPTGGRLAVSGEVQDGRFHFSISGNYHSFGELHPARIEGYVEEYSGPDGAVEAHRIGDFTLTRE